MKILKNRAFTLAEVLITLGIIGVVAAMTIPTLTTKIQHKILQNEFKKMYSDLNNAARLFYVSEDITVHDYDAMTATSSRGDIILAKYMSYFKGTTKSSDKRYDYFDASHNIKQKNLNGSTYLAYTCDESNVIQDVNGRIFDMDNSSYNMPFGPKICVDINGTKAPNRLGYDRFVFVFTEDNNVVPYTGSNFWGISENVTDVEEIKTRCNHSSGTNGNSCAYFALRNQSPDGDGDYWNDFIGKNQYK